VNIPDNNTKRDILIVSRGVPTKEYPMLGLFELDQATALAAFGHNVKMLVVDLRSFLRKRPFGIHHYSINNVEVHIISFPVGAVPREILCKAGGLLLKRLYKTVYGNEKKPEIIHAHFGDIGYIASMLAGQIDVPLVVTEHSSLMNRDVVDKDILEVSGKGYAAANGVISVSNALAQKIKKNTGISSCVIPNIVDTEAFNSIERKQHDGFNFVSVSSLIEIKHIGDLVRAFKIVHEEFPDTKLCIIGDGRERENIKALIDNFHIGDSVRMTGTITRSEIANIFSEMDCFVLPSESETFGVAYIEAMAAGLPVIATKCGGPEDFVNSRVGCLVEKNDIDQLAEAMKKVLKSCNEYDKDYIKNYSETLFSPDAIAGSLTDYYNRIL